MIFRSGLPEELLYSLASLFAFLVLSTAVVLFKTKSKVDASAIELRLRVRTWWWIAAFFGASILLSETAVLALLGFASFLALKEFLSLIPTRRADRRVLFWAYLAVPLQYGWLYADWYGMAIVFIPVWVFLFLPARMVSIGQTKGFLQAAGTIHWGLMTTVFCLSHAGMLAIFRPTDAARRDWFSEGLEIDGVGVALLFFLVVLTQLNDVAQFVAGKSFGRRKIVPSVSPNKTVAGFLGGVITTTLLSAIVGPWLTIMDLQASLAAGLIIGVGGFLGDVTLSALKRDLGVKDSSSFLPGHGGILDRCDSLFFTAPLFFHFINYNYG